MPEYSDRIFVRPSELVVATDDDRPLYVSESEPGELELGEEGLVESAEGEMEAARAPGECGI